MEELRDKHGLTETEYLAQYKPRNYARPGVTADIAVFRRVDGRLKLLLIKRGGHPYLGRWALPGGFVNGDETVEAAAARELCEETCLKAGGLKLSGIYSQPGRDPRMWVISVAYAVMLPDDEAPVRAADDAREACWFDVEVRDCGDGRIELSFAGADEFMAVLCRRPSEEGADVRLCIGNCGGLAFDHAAIIGEALLSLGLLN